MEGKNRIYHIVTLNDFKTRIEDNHYSPSNFEKDGFIHCTREMSTSLLVLEDYFAEPSKSNVILILEIDTTRLESKVIYEPPAPVQGAGASHVSDGVSFPHIYGSLNIDAVERVGKAERVEGKFVWPSTFEDVKMFL